MTFLNTKELKKFKKRHLLPGVLLPFVFLFLASLHSAHVTEVREIEAGNPLLPNPAVRFIEQTRLKYGEDTHAGPAVISEPIANRTLGEALTYMKREENCGIRARENLVTFAAPHLTTAAYIELQYQLLKRFVPHEYKFVVYDDVMQIERDPDGDHSAGRSPGKAREEIQRTCTRLGVEVRKVPQDLHSNRGFLFPFTWEEYVDNYNTRCADVFQYMLKDNLCTTRYLVMMDSDVFLIRPLDVPLYMKSLEADYAGILQSRSYDIHYAWNALQFMDLESMPYLQYFNQDCGVVCTSAPANTSMPANCSAVDVGGQLYYYFKARVQGARRVSSSHFDPSDVAATGVRWMSLKQIEKGGDLPELFHNSGNFSWRVFNSSVDMDSVYLVSLKAAVQEWGFDWEILEDTFLHIRNGGNWAGQSRRLPHIDLFVRSMTALFNAGE